MFLEDGPRPEFDPPLRACPLCGSANTAGYLTDCRGIGIARCRDCALLFMNPQYTDGALAEFYSRYTGHDAAGLRAGYEPERAERKRGNLEMIPGLLGSQRGRFLSIGCGDGLELELASQMGFAVEAYDVDVEAASAVERATGIPVRTGDLLAIEFQWGAYDCVYLDQVLEHPKNPGDYLRLIRRLLKPGGVCYLGVPNIGSMSSLWKTFRDRHGLRPPDRRGRQFDTWHHLHYYHPGCIRRVLEPRYGLRVHTIVGDPEPRLNALTRRLMRKWPILDSSMIVIATAAP